MKRLSHAHVLRLSARPVKGPGEQRRGCEQLDVEQRFQTEAGKTHDFEEGVNAFLDKRKPEFTGK